MTRPDASARGRTTGEVPRGPSPFLLLWTAQFLSQFGDSLFQIAFIWLVLDLTGSKSASGGAATASYFPALLFGIFAGFLADRLDRRLVMVGADILRAALLLLGGALFAAGALTAVNLAAIAFGIATSAVLFNPARDSLLPELVPGERLARANAWVQMSQQAAFLVGPLAAGLLIQWAGVGAAFPAGALLFAGSLGLLLLMRGYGTAHRASRRAPRWAEDFQSGLQSIVADRTLVLLLGLTALDNLFIMGPAILGTAVLVRETLGGTAADYALVEAVYGVGMVLGSIVMARYAHRVRSGALLLWGILLDGFTYVPLIVCPSLGYLLAVSLIHSFVIPVILVPRATILQRVVAAPLRGRIFALQNVVVVGMTAVSIGLTGLVLDAIDVTSLFAIIGVLGGLTGILGAFSRRIRAL